MKADNPLVRGGKLSKVEDADSSKERKDYSGVIFLIIGFVSVAFFVYGIIKFSPLFIFLGVIIFVLNRFVSAMMKDDKESSAKTYDCPDCGEEFEIPEEMINHNKDCKGNEFDCPECGESYNTEEKKNECWKNCLTQEET